GWAARVPRHRRRNLRPPRAGAAAVPGPQSGRGVGGDGRGRGGPRSPEQLRAHGREGPVTGGQFRPVPDPFPHMIVDGLWDPDRLSTVAGEFPHPHDPQWRIFSNPREGKYEGPPPLRGPETCRLFDDIRR